MASQTPARPPPARGGGGGGEARRSGAARATGDAARAVTAGGLGGAGGEPARRSPPLLDQLAGAAAQGEQPGQEIDQTSGGGRAADRPPVRAEREAEADGGVVRAAAVAM